MENETNQSETQQPQREDADALRQNIISRYGRCEYFCPIIRCIDEGPYCPHFLLRR